MNTVNKLTNIVTEQVTTVPSAIPRLINTDLTASNDSVMENGHSLNADGIAPNYQIRNTGLYNVEDQGESELDEGTRISARLYVLKFIKDEDTNEWSRLFLLEDFLGELKKLTIPFGDISGNKKRLVQILSSNGLQIEKDQEQALYDYVIGCKPENPLIKVSKPGWEGYEYVMPECPDALPDSRYLYPVPSRSKNLFKTVGTLEGWKKNVSFLCIDNSLLVFATSVSFSSYLLEPMGETSCGFHISEKSSRGKTTTLKVGKSVLDSPDNLASWRTTDNALEAIASEHNDGCLFLDEFELFTNSNLSCIAKALYMISSGEGKSRYGKSGELKSWRLFYLSSGEHSLRDVYARSNKTPHAGEEVRFIDISADVGTGNGSFNTTHDYSDGAAFADALNKNVKLNHGAAGRAFIKELISDKELYTSFAQDLKRDFLTKLNLVDVDPQVRRVAEKIGTVVAGGELATEMGITGWPEGHASWAGEECFKSWLKMRGGVNSQETDIAVNTVQSKLIQLGHSKFITEENPTTKGLCWGKREGNDYFILTDVFNNIICKNMNARSVTSQLVQEGFITQANDGRSSRTKRIDGKVVRCIHINETLFAATTEENILTNTTES